MNSFTLDGIGKKTLTDDFGKGELKEMAKERGITYSNKNKGDIVNDILKWKRNNKRDEESWEIAPSPSKKRKTTESWEDVPDNFRNINGISFNYNHGDYYHGITEQVPEQRWKQYSREGSEKKKQLAKTLEERNYRDSEVNGIILTKYPKDAEAVSKAIEDFRIKRDHTIKRGYNTNNSPSWRKVRLSQSDRESKRVERYGME